MRSNEYTNINESAMYCHTVEVIVEESGTCGITGWAWLSLETVAVPAIHATNAEARSPGQMGPLTAATQTGIQAVHGQIKVARSWGIMDNGFLLVATQHTCKCFVREVRNLFTCTSVHG